MNMNKLVFKKMVFEHFRFKQSTTINPNDIEVKIDLCVIKSSDDKIKGKTNLCDYVSLVLSVFDENKKMSQAKCIVRKEEFEFKQVKVFSNKIKIVAGIPDVQDNRFIEKVGQEYENLLGQLIDRNGIGPIIEYEKEIYL